MRIMMMTYCLETAGSHIMALSLASSLVKEGHQVYFFNQYEQLVDQEMVNRFLVPEVTLLTIDKYPLLDKLSWKINGVLKRLGCKFSFHEKVKDYLFRYWIKHYKIDIINSHDLWLERSRLNLLRGEVPVVLTDHGGYQMQVKIGDLSFIEYANKANAVVEVSEYSRDILMHAEERIATAEEKRLGLTFIERDYKADVNSGAYKGDRLSSLGKREALQVPVYTIHNGIVWRAKTYTTSAKAFLQIPQDAFVYGMVGRGTPQKGWQQAIDAFFKVTERSDKAVYLVLVGGGAYINELRQKYASVKNILFTGETADPQFYIESFDVGLLPSCFSEGLPLTAIEYLFSGKPVIASRLGGIPEIVEVAAGGPAGFLIPMEADGTPNVSILSDLMCEYLEDRNTYLRHQQAGVKARAKFSMETCAKAYIHLFEHLLKKENSQRVRL